VRNNQIVALPSYAVWGRIDVVAEPCCSWVFFADSTDGEPFSSVGNNEITFIPLSDARLAVFVLNSFAAADTATVSGDEELTIRMSREPDGLLHDYRYTYSGPLPPLTGSAHALQTPSHSSSTRRSDTESAAL
jgi:hypothetical protein